MDCLLIPCFMKSHGLGIKNTLNYKGTVRQSLKEHASALAEYFTTFMAGIFRSVRFGASSAHGKPTWFVSTTSKRKEILAAMNNAYTAYI